MTTVREYIETRKKLEELNAPNFVYAGCKVAAVNTDGNLYTSDYGITPKHIPEFIKWLKEVYEVEE